MSIPHRILTRHLVFRLRNAAGGRLAVVALAAGLVLGGCFQTVEHRGYVVPEGGLEQIPLGATQEQVLIVLGTPSTVATVSGEVFYYISQRTERAAQFMPAKVADQRVIAVYFDRKRRVERLANYGLQDGRVVDYVTRTTPAGGTDYNYIQYLFKIIGKG